MKKALIVLVAIAVAIGFASTVFAAGAKVTGKEKVKVKETATGTQTTTKGKIVGKSGKAGHREKMVVKVLQIEDRDANNDSDNTITFLNRKNEKMTLKLHKDIKVNKLQRHKDKMVILSTYAVTPQTLATDGLVEGWEPKQ